MAASEPGAATPDVVASDASNPGTPSAVALHSDASNADVPNVEHRLAVYGTLAPGRSNEHIMADIDGTWTPGLVRGTRYAEGWGAAAGYPGIILDDGGDVECMLFESSDLPRHWEMLDEFEGEGYRRVPTLVRVEGETREAYIYELSGR